MNTEKTDDTTATLPYWAKFHGISYLRFLRAAKKLGLEIRGHRDGGLRITKKKSEEVLAQVVRGEDGKKVIPAPMRYEISRQGFLDTWSQALATTEDLETFTKKLQVYGVICAAKNRDNLDIELNGWRVGDIFLEVAQGLGVDRIEGGGFDGFTAWLQEQGYQSPGWNVI